MGGALGWGLATLAGGRGLGRLLCAVGGLVAGNFAERHRVQLAWDPAELTPPAKETAAQSALRLATDAPEGTS